MTLWTAHFLFRFRQLVRQPGFWVPAVLFPAMLFSFFGVSLATDVTRATFAMASFAIYAVAGVAFYQFGAGIAQERETPFDAWTRLLPGGGVPSVAARMATAGVFALVAVLLVIAAAYLLSAPDADAARLLALLGVCAFAALPASLMGITLGYLASGRAAVALANLIYLPLAYLGGLWVPPRSLPATIDAISQFTPTRHMGELAWHAIAGQDLPANSLYAVAGFTALFALTTFWAMARDTARRFG